MPTFISTYILYLNTFNIYFYIYIYFRTFKVLFVSTFFFKFFSPGLGRGWIATSEVFPPQKDFKKKNSRGFPPPSFSKIRHHPVDRLARGWETPKISNFPKSRGCRGLEEPLQEGKFPSRMIPGPRSGVFRVRQTLIGSIRTRRANIPNYLPESAATSPPLRPPGPDRLSAPARRSQNPLHAGEIRVGALRCSPSAISAPKSSLRRGDLIRNCRRVWGTMVRGGGG